MGENPRPEGAETLPFDYSDLVHSVEDGLWVSRDGTRARSRVPALGTSCRSCPQHLTPSSLSPFWNSLQKHIPGSFSSCTTISLPLAPLWMLPDLSYLWLWVCFSVLRSDSSPLSTLILSVSSSSPGHVRDPSSEGSLIFCPDWDFLTHMTIHHVFLSNSAALGLPPFPTLLHLSSGLGQKLGVIHGSSLFYTSL